MRKIILSCAVMFFVIFMQTQIFATTYIVTKAADTNDGTCDSDCSLREAIAVATSGDTINFNASYTITLSSQLTINKNLTITGYSDDPDDTIIRAHEYPDTVTWRVFEITSGYTVVLGYMTIQNGNIEGSGYQYGGGIKNAGTLTLDHINLTGNKVEMTSGDWAYGGGVYSSGTLTIVDSYIHDNTALCTVGITKCIGGGISFNTSSATASLTISNSTISDNISNTYNRMGSGGGISFNNSATTCATSKIYNTTIYNNKLLTGGGFGAGIDISSYNCSYSLEITASTITENTYTGGSDILGGGLSSSGNDTKLKSTIIANNDGTEGPDCCDQYGTLSSYGYNFIEDNSDCGITNTEGSNTYSTDPLFEATDEDGETEGNQCPTLCPDDTTNCLLCNNGGSTYTIKLSSSSTAKEAWSGSLTRIDGTSMTLDQRTYSRTSSYSTGAYEYGGALFEGSLDDMDFSGDTGDTNSEFNESQTEVYSSGCGFIGTSNKVIGDEGFLILLLLGSLSLILRFRSIKEIK
ncbi:MAG: CSLREA domain-containing protein [Pseudomonadota bacterium]